MKVLFVTAEAEPFAKAGGLGDVGGALPSALAKLDCQTRVIMPKYSIMPPHLLKKIYPIAEFKVSMGWRRQYCGLSKLIHEGVHYYFIDNEYYFKRDKLYGYDDDGERYAFFCKAVLEGLLHNWEFPPDIIHCNDWHTALLPVLLREQYPSSSFYYGVKSLFTIHNLQHQGVFPWELLNDLLDMEAHSSLAQNLSYGDQVNYMKGAILTSDMLTTVSPTYAKEILDVYYGEGLDAVLRQRRNHLIGILNGIDTVKYNPQNDPALANHFPKENWKKDNKKNIQMAFNLPFETDKPLLAMVTRLADQKGIDLLLHILDELLSLDVQLVILGTGENKYENALLDYMGRYPGKLGVKIMFHDELARKIYAGADILLMPSRFEPCGLSQMIAMSYGTIPLVRETGGLKDSVEAYNEKQGIGNGFTFYAYNAHEFLFAIKRALGVYNHQEKNWQLLMERAMSTDFSWQQSAQKYIDLYKKLLN